MKTRIIALALIGSAAFTSCDDFLTETPKYALTTDNAVRDYNSANNAVTGIYGEYKSCSYLGGYIYANLHCMAGMWNYSSLMFNMGYTQSANDGIISTIWRQLYSIINVSNSAIQGIEKLDETVFAEGVSKGEMLGEARCFRGYLNLQLLWLFARWFDKPESPYGIIYRDQVAELSNLQVGRISVGESYEKIIDDLKYAEENAPEFSTALRMNRQFAKAMHAKLLLVRGWDGDYAEALRLVEQLLADKSSKWKMETDLTKLYENGWNSMGNVFSRYLGDQTGYTNGISGYEYVYSAGLFYYPEFTDPIQEWLNSDVRHDLTFGTARSPETWDTTKKENILTKLYHRGRVDGKNDMYATYPMRYAELYLMKAELLARTNPSDIQSAIAPVNEMRAKYTNPAMEPLTGINTHAELMDALFKEYVVTLFLENETPWFASLRFEHEGTPWINILKPDVNFSPNQYCWPIPEEEIKAHNNPIEQNPGLE